jgi:hypothetical protein
MKSREVREDRGGLGSENHALAEAAATPYSILDFRFWILDWKKEEQFQI